jgi:hypothetical protein
MEVGGGIRDVDAVVGGQSGQSGVPALPDGPEFPLLAAQIQLAQHHRCLRACIGDVEPDPGLPSRVHYVKGETVDISEAHAVRGVQAGQDHDRADVRWKRLQIHRHSVLGGVVPGPLAQQAHRTVTAAGRVVEHEVLV